MPRKTNETYWDAGEEPVCFNEAAARCRGKPRRQINKASEQHMLQ